ncbi:MAG: ABC transporter ATP-binding protein [Coriobacteriia bacterium]|nr:ABC transporter ATP-binding protein [Coriobacteriia bacterium]MBS5478798.1 ABC transporter ATP-binding protein [Coriobacteriia bacterium]
MAPTSASPQEASALSLRDVRFGYARRREVLHGISATMHAGELTAIVGPNGCGKTTLVKCIDRINRPWDGSIELQGDDAEDLLACPLERLARLVGYVPQRASTELAGSVVDYLLLGRRPFLSWQLSADDLRAVDAVMERLGIAGLANEALAELSGGQRQKIVVARALLQEPRVLLFDEPTSSLDIKNQREIMDLAAELAHAEGKIVAVVLHDLNAALAYADQVVLLDGGAVVCAGDPRDVLSPATIERVYGTPVTTDARGRIDPFGRE